MHQNRYNSSVAITFTPHPALYRVASEPAPKPPAPAATPYQRLKELDQQLDRGEENLAEARRLYQQTLKEFATLCHELWKEQRAQGSRQGQGFRSCLQEAGIKVGRAYRAMQKFFPADFPVHAKPKTAKALTSSAADEVGLRFTGKLHGGKEVLECVFALTLEEKAEFEKCLAVLDASQVQRLLLEAVKQAAKKRTVTDEPQAEITSKACPRGESASRRDAGCCTVTHDSGRRISNGQSIPSISASPSISSTPSEVRTTPKPEIPKACPQGERAIHKDKGCSGASPAAKPAIPSASTSSASEQGRL